MGNEQYMVYNRVKEKEKDLGDKIYKLREFLSDRDKAVRIVGYNHFGLLNLQLSSMLLYQNILSQRLDVINGRTINKGGK